MDNVYVQDEFERNSIAELPDGFSEKAGGILYSWLGSIWRDVHSGDKMVKGLQGARGMRLAQLYLDIIESAKLQDRNGIPVFHRELWHPIVIKKSERDTAQENMVKMESGVFIGPQLPGGIYDEGTVLEMGKLAKRAEYVSYPIDEGIVGMSASIVDNPINPEVEMKHDVDFVFRNNSIIFRRENDPLSQSSPFEKLDIPTDDPEDPDIECVLWASDVLFDRNYIADHLSYALGANSESSYVVKRIINAAWSSIASGLTPDLIKTLMAAMLNIPVIQHRNETVVDIETETDNDGNDVSTLVHTDLGSYRVSLRAKLRKCVYVGAVLHGGDLLDESLRVYPYLNSSNSDFGFSVPLEQDIPSIVLPSDIIRVKTKYGLYAMWGSSVVRRSEDGNRNHLFFDIGGEKDDVAAFWNDVWSESDRTGVSMSDIIGGGEGSIVSPAKFFVKNLIGANTLFVVIDESQIDDASFMHDPMFFGMLSDAVPSGIRMFVVEHRGVRDFKCLDCTKESTFLAAALPKVSECVAYGPLKELEGRGPSFVDMVNVRFVRPSPPKTKGRKEEE